MFLWLERTQKISLIKFCIRSTTVNTVLSTVKTGMTKKPSSSCISSGQRLLHTPSKINPSRKEYEELNDLLSDSDGWEEDLHIKPIMAGQNMKSILPGHPNKGQNDLSDADDSIICELLQTERKIDIQDKNLAGAYSKPYRKLPPRNSFSSYISDEVRQPIVESTQQGDLLGSEDSRLLLSLLKGESVSSSEETNKVKEKRKTTARDTATVNQSFKEDPKEDRLRARGQENHKIVVSELNINESPIVSFKKDQPKGLGYTDVKEKDETTPSEEWGFEKWLENDKSLEIVKEQEKVQYADKFVLLTQRPGLQSTQEIEKRLKDYPKAKIIVPVRLSKEQEDVIHLAEAGHNIFYTGSAGTGKSVLLREMIKVLTKMYGKEQVAVTASTGLAACNIGGVTVHSFAGVGLGNGEVTKIYRKVRRSRKHVKRWESISALVVDEISMLDGDLLEKLDFIAQKIRKNCKPFGGIQLIFCGDFFQLPPVSKDPSNPTKFAFESSVWKEGIDVTIMLTKVFRQQGDSKFIEMLNKMRLGQIDAETEMEFKKLSRPLPEDEIIPAELYSTRNEVERANCSRLKRLPGKVHTFHAIDGGALEDRDLKEKLLQNFLAPKELQLKIGAQVMMIKNIDATLVNGSLGKVIDFIDPETYMFYETIVRNPDLSPGALMKLKENPELLRETWNEFCDDGDHDAPVRQKTVKEAFCKSGVDESVAQLGETIFDFLQDVSSNDIETSNNLERKKELLKQVHESSKAKRKLPLVRFKTSDMSTRTILVEPESWAIEDENEKPLVSRVQLPLMLAWSLSIHKSQGQTLPKVKVDLRRVFEKGQAYVALSRAVSREGLQVLNFDKSRINAHQKVIDFYSTLVTVEHAIKSLNATTETVSLNKKRKVVAENHKPTFERRARQPRSRSNTPGSQNGITAMLMQRKRGTKLKQMAGKNTPDADEGSLLDNFEDPKTRTSSHNA